MKRTHELHYIFFIKVRREPIIFNIIDLIFVVILVEYNRPHSDYFLVFEFLQNMFVEVELQRLPSKAQTAWLHHGRSCPVIQHQVSVVVIMLAHSE